MGSTDGNDILGVKAQVREVSLDQESGAFSYEESRGRTLAKLVTKVISNMAGGEAKPLLLRFGVSREKKCG